MPQRQNCQEVREIGRSERIRTSDPLLPKQVRYQTALRSDRGGRVSLFTASWQGGCYLPGRSRLRKIRPMRGMSPVSARDLLDSTGLFFDTAAVPSRKTI